MQRENISASFESKNKLDDEDAKLVAQVIAKDTQAFETLFKKYYNYVRYIVDDVFKRRLNTHEEIHGCVQDATQEVFISVWNKADQHSPELANFKSWLAGVAKNQALNSSGTILRHGKYFDEGETYSGSFQHIDWIDSLTAPNHYSNEPEERLLLEEWMKITGQRIDAAKSKLTGANQQEVINALRNEIDQYEPKPTGRQKKPTKIIAAGGYERLAEKLGISPSATKSSLHRARKSMQNNLSKCSEEYELLP